jgi:hypothetical protein
LFSIKCNFYPFFCFSYDESENAGLHGAEEEVRPNIEEVETQEEPGILERLEKATDNLLPGNKPFNPGEKSFNYPSCMKSFARFKWIAETFKGSHRRETLQLPPASKVICYF